MNLKNDKCELRISLDRRGYANVYYIAELISGEWPDNTDLIVACDNGTLGGPNRTFGGIVESLGDKKRYVTVYID